MDNEQPDIEWVILADSAEVINNKLYLMGGGWETLVVNTEFPVLHPCAVAVSFLVPWSEEPSRVINIRIDIAADDGPILSQTTGQAEVARLPDRVPGQPDRLQVALKLGLVVERPGGYIATARVEEKEKSAHFTVVAGPGLPEMAIAVPPRKRSRGH